MIPGARNVCYRRRILQVLTPSCSQGESRNQQRAESSRYQHGCNGGVAGLRGDLHLLGRGNHLAGIHVRLIHLGLTGLGTSFSSTVSFAVVVEVAPALSVTLKMIS